MRPKGEPLFCLSQLLRARRHIPPESISIHSYNFYAREASSDLIEATEAKTRTTPVDQGASLMAHPNPNPNPEPLPREKCGEATAFVLPSSDRYHCASFGTTRVPGNSGPRLHPRLL